MTRWLVILACALAPALAAQQPADTGAPPQPLLREFRQRWHERLQEALAMSPEQAAKLQATEDRFAAQRRPITQSQRQIQMALRGQLSPGATADADSVARLLSARLQNRAALLQLEQQEDQEMTGYLSPVQRARYQFMRQQLQERIMEMRRRRAGPRAEGDFRDSGPPSPP